MAETWSNEIPVVPTTLRNELVLEKIFQFLPMRSLLSCSEVCKLWSKQARTYIRDQRKWTISICPPLACNHFNDLDETVGKMALVPFNSLDFYLEPHENCLSNQHQGHGLRLSCENVFARLKLKYLSICLEGEVPTCPALLTVFRLLLEKGNEIKGLQLGRISFSFAQLFTEIHNLEMPELETVQLGALYDDWSQEFVRKILRGSNPKLRKIINSSDNRILEILPESKLRYLSNFTFAQFDGASMNRAMKLAESQPTLSDMQVSLLNISDHQIPFQCLKIVQSFIRTSYKSLRKLDLDPVCILKSISFPPLENVVSLKLKGYCDPGEIRSSLHFIQFGRMFPKLQDVQVSSRDEEDLWGARALELDNESVLEHHWDPQNCSRTTSVLALEGIIRSFSFPQLQKSFPAVVDLAIMPTVVDTPVVPYRLIFRLWPNLRTLSIAGTTFFPLPNCDAEFCGIYQEEAELLRTMDEEYLKNVHIVPVRPCVTTMLSLNMIAVNLRCQDPNPFGMERVENFLSTVTKFLVFQRMSWLTVQLNIQSENDA